MEDYCYMVSGKEASVVSMEYVDMIKAGIIDPSKVTRSALQNADSAAMGGGMGGMPGMM